VNYIDVRSDTVTWPTEAMRVAMASAPVGDDVYGDDPTMNELERLAAEMTGKEAAIFVPSGTFGNQLALFTWCPRGSEVILGEQCHIVQHEAGAASVIAGVQTRTIFAPNGILPVDEIEARIRGDDIHYPSTTLICLENAHSSGRVISLDSMKEVAALAKRYGLPIHLDGARLFNAAIALGVRAADIAAHVDSVMFCLSKGLCAPIGSMLAGPRDFIEKARRKRKIMGGGMRQAGILAAAGLICVVVGSILFVPTSFPQWYVPGGYQQSHGPGHHPTLADPGRIPGLCHLQGSTRQVFSSDQRQIRGRGGRGAG